jgi:hypothetical protein
MEPEGSLPCSQQPATGPYPKPDASSPHPSFLISFHLRLGLPIGLFHASFLTVIFYEFVACPMRAPQSDLIALKIFGRVYNVWSSSLCSCIFSGLELT